MGLGPTPCRRTPGCSGGCPGGPCAAALPGPESELDLPVQQAATALHRLGALALDRCLGAYITTPRDALRDRLAGVMSRWGLHDERIYATLLDTLQRTPELGANYLVDYGEARALEVLAQTFDALPIQEGDNPLANHVFIELRCAIEDLGGQLTEAQQQKFTQADAPPYAPRRRANPRSPQGSASWAGTRPVGEGMARSTRSVISPWSRAKGTAKLLPWCGTDTYLDMLRKRGGAARQFYGVHLNVCL